MLDVQDEEWGGALCPPVHGQSNCCGLCQLTRKNQRQNSLRTSAKSLELCPVKGRLDSRQLATEGLRWRTCCPKESLDTWEFELNSGITRMLWKRWLTPTVDCFASDNFHSVEVYYSFDPDPRALRRVFCAVPG